MSLLLKPITVLLNAALRQDPDTMETLLLFEHRRIKIEITDLALTIDVLVHLQQLELTLNTQEEADLTLSATAATLLKLGREPDSLFSSDITLHGDVKFAKQLQDLLENIDFDWEAQLARVTGDTLAYPLAHLLRQTAQWCQQTHQSVQQTTAEYLREEARLLPDQSQIQRYLAQIDDLHADTDRLEARISRLVTIPS